MGKNSLFERNWYPVLMFGLAAFHYYNDDSLAAILSLCFSLAWYAILYYGDRRDAKYDKNLHLHLIEFEKRRVFIESEIKQLECALECSDSNERSKFLLEMLNSEKTLLDKLIKANKLLSEVN